MMKHVLRDVREEDAQQIENIANSCPPLRASVKGTYEYLAICFGRYFIGAWGDAEILGFIVGFPNVSKPGECWIYQIAVRPEYQKNNIGKRLLEEEISRFKSDNHSIVKARVLDYNEASIQLFKGMLFERASTLGRWLEFELEI